MNQPTKQEANAVSKDIRENISRLQSFLDRVIQHSSNGTIHPELYESDCDTLRESIQRLKEFRRYIESLPEQGEAVGEVVLESMGVGDAKVVRFHMYKEIPPVGTKLYTQPAIPPGYAVPDEVRSALECFENLAAHLGGCSNHGCVINPPAPGMMGTNGQCQCYRNGTKAQRMLYAGRNLAKKVRSMLASAPAIQPQAAAPSAPVAEKGLPENVKLLLLKAHHQLETEYRQQTRATEAKRVANGTCGESPGGASSIALLAESGYISSIGKRNQEVRDEIFTMLAAPADSKEGE